MNSFKTFIAATALATVAFTGAALAGDMTISKPWARASAGMAKAGAAFMFIYNETGMDDTLVAAKADVSKKVELHTHLMEGGVMKMREVEGGIPVKNGTTQELKPGSYHVMFMGLNEPLKEGSSFPVTLVFEHAGEKTIKVEVMGPGAMGDMAKHKMGGMQNMDHGNMPGMGQ
ncbi:copper chaperone PCu(A)C [Magnetovibrio sp.]|uniref:copper chaperone PCu(A)C n=1 Tax=Magnetovibrio sp. TaxID=2024836 RepID=UPI002F91EA2A